MDNLLSPILSLFVGAIGQRIGVQGKAPVYYTVSDGWRTYHALDDNNELTPIDLEDSTALMAMLSGPAQAVKGVQVGNCAQNYDLVQRVRVAIVSNPFRPNLANAFYQPIPAVNITYARASVALVTVQLDPYQGHYDVFGQGAGSGLPPSGGAVWADYDLKITVNTQCLIATCPSPQ